MKNASILIILFCLGCFCCRAQQYQLSFALTKEKCLDFYLLVGGKTGHFHGWFSKQKKPYSYVKPMVYDGLEPEPNGKSVVHHLALADEIVTFRINKLIFKIENDRTITLWGGDKNDCVFIHNRERLNLRLACEHFEGTVLYQLRKSRGWKPIIIKPFNK